MTTLYDLTEPLGHTAQKFADMVPPQLSYENTMVRAGSNTQRISTSLHFGTHLDAPFHFAYPADLSDIPLEWVYGTGVIVAIPKQDWEVITAADLEQARPAIQKNDIVIINTGFHKYWGKDEDRYAYKYPGLGTEAVDWLVQKKIKMIGCDTISPEHIFSMHDNILQFRPDIFREKIDRTKFPPFYAHHQFLSRQILILEQVGGQIAEVTGQRVILAAFPLKLVHGDGCPVRIVAIKE
ncbi:MAG: cyclase family protein [Planctomycetes bacterium]|nr:cyclase family protein [Planctomycetota bacterium]